VPHAPTALDQVLCYQPNPAADAPRPVCELPSASYGLTADRQELAVEARSARLQVIDYERFTAFEPEQ